jgi:hypothetical protein
MAFDNCCCPTCFDSLDSFDFDETCPWSIFRRFTSVKPERGMQGRLVGIRLNLLRKILRKGFRKVEEYNRLPRSSDPQRVALSRKIIKLLLPVHDNRGEMRRLLTRVNRPPVDARACTRETAFPRDFSFFERRSRRADRTADSLIVRVTLTITTVRDCM